MSFLPVAYHLWLISFLLGYRRLLGTWSLPTSGRKAGRDLISRGAGGWEFLLVLFQILTLTLASANAQQPQNRMTEEGSPRLFGTGVERAESEFQNRLFLEAMP